MSCEWSPVKHRPAFVGKDPGACPDPMSNKTLEQKLRELPRYVVRVLLSEEERMQTGCVQPRRSAMVQSRSGHWVRWSDVRDLLDRSES